MVLLLFPAVRTYWPDVVRDMHRSSELRYRLPRGIVIEAHAVKSARPFF